MAVSIQETVFNHIANGVTVDFAYGCKILDVSDLIVFVDDVRVTTGFTVNNVGQPAGGSVTFDAPPGNGKKIRLERIIQLKRTTDYQQNGDFLARVVNPEFDRLWMALQQFESVVGLAPGSFSKLLMLGRGDTNGEGSYRALQNRIQDVADPVASQDVVNLRFLLARIASLSTDGTGAAVMELLTNSSDNSLGVSLIGGASRPVSSIAALKALPKALVRNATVLGYYAPGDGGGGQYYLDVLDTASADNGGTVIVAADGGRWKLAQSGSVSLLQFGATAESADQTTRIQAAISSGAAVIDGRGLTYRVDSSITLRSNLVLQNATFDFSIAAASDTLFEAFGSMGASASFTATTRGATTFTVSSSAGIGAGTWLYLESNNQFGVGMTKNGEFVEVRSIAGTTVTPFRRLQDAYTTTPLFYKPTLLENITLRNLKLIGRGNGYNQVGAYFYVCRNVTLDNVTAEKFADRGFNVIRCMDVTIGNVKSFHSDTSTGLAYGIVVGNGCERVTIANSVFKDHRHGISIGAENGVDRYISVTNCSVTDSTDGGIDCHPGAQFVSITGNTVGHGSTVASQDGIVVQCANVTVTGNVVQGFSRAGIFLQDLGGAAGPTDVHSVISGNNISQSIGLSSTYGIAIENQRAASGMRFTVSGNTIDMTNTTAGVGIHVEIVPSGSAINGAAITGNTVFSRYEALKVLTATDKVLRCLVVSGNSFETLGAGYDVTYFAASTLNYIERCILVGNSLYGGRYGIYMSNCSRMKADANMIQAFATAATIGTLVGTNDNYSA